jgi:two-component system cell cycle sensor histidine kinase/response regulator CckA
MATVLLVEDDAAVRRVIRHMLVEQRHEVLEAGSAPEAIQVAGAHPGRIDLLLTDVVMPQTNCDDLVSQLQTNRPEMKVILVSGYSDDVLRQYGVNESVSNFLPKPFTAEKLAAKIREVLGNHQHHGGGA